MERFKFTYCLQQELFEANARKEQTGEILSVTRRAELDELLHYPREFFSTQRRKLFGDLKLGCYKWLALLKQLLCFLESHSLGNTGSDFFLVKVVIKLEAPSVQDYHVSRDDLYFGFLPIFPNTLIEQAASCPEDIDSLYGSEEGQGSS